MVTGYKNHASVGQAIRTTTVQGILGILKEFEPLAIFAPHLRVRVPYMWARQVPALLQPGHNVIIARVYLPDLLCLQKFLSRQCGCTTFQYTPYSYASNCFELSLYARTVKLKHTSTLDTLNALIDTFGTLDALGDYYAYDSSKPKVIKVLNAEKLCNILARGAERECAQLTE